MAAINAINRAGSIRAAVESQVLRSGVMYECVKNDVPFLLAGSIRDDGPLPGDGAFAPSVVLHEMRPVRGTEAHLTDGFVFSAPPDVGSRIERMS